MSPKIDPKKTTVPQAQVIKARLRKALVAKKKTDLDLVNGRGKEVLSFLRTNAKNDLEKIEAALFSKYDFDELTTKFEDVLADDSEAEADN